jgi:hypothetical protein
MASDHPRLPNEVRGTRQGRQPLLGHRPGGGRHHHRSVLLLPREEVIPGDKLFLKTFLFVTD